MKLGQRENSGVVLSRTKTMDFRRANFGLFKDLLRGILWVRALEGRGVAI